MKVTESSRPFSKPDWIFELKLDGFRSIAYVESGNVRILSSNGNEAQRSFPAITRSLAAIPVDAVFDGELVCFDERGLPSFACMQSRFHVSDSRSIEVLERSTPATYCIFDLLYLGGYDLQGCTLRDRRRLLEGLGIDAPGLRILDAYPEEGKLLFEHVKELGFEGVIGKRLDSTYVPGSRSLHWVKVKAQRTEDFVIGGYTEGEGLRQFGSLLLGTPEDSRLRFVGSSGGGFNDKQLAEISALLQTIETKESPFTGPVTTAGKKHFVEPLLWAEVSFQSYTPGGVIRIPVFQRLRTDLMGLDAKD